ncbi:MAG: hypothetical protein R2710_27995 [Acidimicrobiales bacterium]
MFEQVAVSFAGLIWAAEVLLLAMLSVSLNRVPLRLVLGTMLMVVPVFWGSLLTFSRPVGGSAAATIFGLVSLPLATTAAAVAVGESARSERLIRKGLTAFACGIAASTLVKVAVLGTGGRELQFSVVRTGLGGRSGMADLSTSVTIRFCATGVVGSAPPPWPSRSPEPQRWLR